MKGDVMKSFDVVYKNGDGIGKIIRMVAPTAEKVIEGIKFWKGVDEEQILEIKDVGIEIDPNKLVIKV